MRSTLKGKKRISIRLVVMIFFATISLCLSAAEQPEMSRQEQKQIAKLEKSIKTFFEKINSVNKTKASYTRYRFDREEETFHLYGDSVFATLPFTPATIDATYALLKKHLKRPFKNYTLTIFANDIPIQNIQAQAQPLLEQTQRNTSRFIHHAIRNGAYWGNIDYEDYPWVSNTSRPYIPSYGLQGRHLTVWASHGIYYNVKKQRWIWQRVPLHLTREDLFTQTIVVPYLIPMLEDAGAVVFTPRERDWQRNEVVVDNDLIFGNSRYKEKGKWENTPLAGFAPRDSVYRDGENPFTYGTGRQTVSSTGKPSATVTYIPDITEEGEYAVYVSYHTLAESINDAHYIVRHKGIETHFCVNQQMGSHTWVYLGTFEFAKGHAKDNCVVLTNESAMAGIITTDAVRFGGGMGNVSRGEEVSGYPRSFEGARYYAQYAGMPYDVYSVYQGADDFKDDINVRSLMSNHISGGSVFNPDTVGLRVPVELSVAIHTDAGYHKNGRDIWGTLGICTTHRENADTFRTGLSRNISRTFAEELVSSAVNDLSGTFPNWAGREVWDRNYSESRLPNVPSAIIETLSHESFPDMQMAWDPHFRFTLARSIYKSILRTVCNAHGEEYVITPLAPKAFGIEFTDKDEVRLQWSPSEDRLEPTAQATSYILYTKKGDSDFDNGIVVDGTSHTMRLMPGVLYAFKVAAVNNGGKSFPTEVLTAYYHPSAKKQILIVNGFHRLSAPATTKIKKKEDFDISIDAGVWLGKNPAWVDYLGQYIMGDNRDNTLTHAQAIIANGQYNIVSCSSEIIENGDAELKNYDMIDLILGNQCDDGRSLVPYKSLSLEMQERLTKFLCKGKALFLSGSFIASDAKTEKDSIFLCRHLHVTNEKKTHDGTASCRINGMSSSFTYYGMHNEKHYAAPHTDVITATEDAIPAMFYDDFDVAAVAYSSHKYSTFVLSVPFECIQQKRDTLMGKILKTLLR